MGRVIVSGGCEMTVPVNSETWMINDELADDQVISCPETAIPFVTVDQPWVSIKGDSTGLLWESFDGETVYVYRRGTGWGNQKYPTITFSLPNFPTGDLLTWLQANAVKVG